MHDQDHTHTPHTQKPRLAHRRGGIFVHAVEMITEPAYWMIDWFETHFERRYRGKYRHARKLFFADLILVGFIAILASTAVWVLFLRTTLADEMVFTTEATPLGLISGAPATFTIHFQNTSRETIEQAVLSVRTPRHFELLRSFPKTFEARTSTLPIGTLRPGETGRAKLSGLFWGEVGTDASLLITMAMTSSETGKRHLTYERFDIPITGSVLQGTLAMPAKVVVGQPAPFTFAYAHVGQETLPAVFFKPAWPDESPLLHSDPTIQSEDTWTVGDLVTDASGTITGAVQPVGPGERDIEFGIHTFIIKNGEPLGQGTVTLTRALIPSPLELVATLENLGGDAVQPGSTLLVRVRAANVGDVLLDNVSAGLTSRSPFVDASGLPDSVDLPPLGPGEHHTTTLPLTLNTQPIIPLYNEENHTELQLSIQPTGSAFLVDGIPLAISVQGPAIVRNLTTLFVPSAVARYWTPQGDQIGRGFMPPLAGETTKYWIFWQLSPTTNNLEQLTFSTTLPPGVQWTGQSNVTAGSPIQWDPRTRTIRWNVGELRATLGTGQSVGGRFEVALTPTPEQIGTTPVLIQDTFIQAYDTFTSIPVTATAPPLDISLPSDWRARGRTRVQP